MSVYKGWTYEIDAHAVLNIVVGSNALDFVDVSWEGDWITQSYVSKIAESKSGLDLRLSKTLVVADSYTTIRSNIGAYAVDRYWSPLVFDARDTGELGWEISEEVLPHNEPDICIQDTVVVQEGSEGQITTNYIQVCLSESAQGEALTVNYRTRNGTAEGGIGVRNLAYDEFGNPFVSVTESAADKIRIVYDGGFPKYYNASMNANSLQFLKNCVAYCHHTPSRAKRILATGDASGNYDITGTDGSDFRTSFQTLADQLGYQIDFINVGNFHGGNPTQADFAPYGMMVYLGSAPDQCSNTFADSAHAAALTGMGMLLITDHEPFQPSVNVIARKFNAEFYGNVDRHPVPISELKAKYGDHVLWSGMSGDFQAGGSEGNIRNKAKGEYLESDGVLRFEIGETCKNIPFDIFGNNDITGNKYFYMDLSNNSHGNITCPTGTIVIDDDDVLPCGESASSGGDGVAYFKLTAGSEPSVVVALWMSYAKHDRLDMYKNGQWVSGSQQDLDTNFGEPNPSYDRAAYNVASGGIDGTPITALRQHKRNRAGGGAIFHAFYPLMTADPFYADLRVEGPDGTGWDFGTMCFPAKDISTASNLVLDNSIIQRIDHLEIFDCEANLAGQTGRFRFAFNNLTGDPFGTANRTTFAKYDLNSSIGFRTLPCRLHFYRNRVLVHSTGWIAVGANATVEIDHNKDIDFRYLEMNVEYDISGIDATYLIRTDYQGSNQSKPPRVAWRMTVNRI